MKVFISWSGEQSHEIAVALRGWLPSVIQALDPYESSEDIDKGARWSTDISKELEGSSFGILCITPENLQAPWLNFEAGALSKSFDHSRVSPFLIGIKWSEVQGPLLQFQAVTSKKQDVLKLLKSLNAACGEDGIPEDRLGHIFDTWWPELAEKLAAIEKEVKKGSAKTTVDDQQPIGQSDVLEEVLELVRLQQKILSSPTDLLPPGYLAEVIRESSFGVDVEPAIFDLDERYRRLWSVMEAGDLAALEDRDWADALMDAVDRLGGPIRYIARQVRGPRRLRRS